MTKNIRDIRILTGRHMKLFFKDKQSVLTSLITPLILIVLFVTFLKSVYEESLLSLIPVGIELDTGLVDAFTVSWLLASILGVTCVTLAFCANTIMITDKVNSSLDDMLIAPVSKISISLSYYVANFLSTLLVGLICLVAGTAYINSFGMYMSGHDILMIVIVILLTTSFGTLLASIVETFISSQGGASAVATLVSSMYGFVCGAYMPISQFSKGIQTFVGMIPGTHGTILFRYFFMNGIIDEMGKELPDAAVNQIRAGFDNELYLFDKQISNGQMFAVLGATSVVLLIVFIAITIIRNRRRGG